MRRFGFGFFVGIVIVFIGASIALDALFDIHVLVFRLALALLVFAIGLRVLAGRSARERRSGDSGEAWLADRRFAPEGALTHDARFDVVFGRGLVDLSHLEAPAEDVTVQVDAVFGTAVVKMNPAVPYDVSGSSAFGEVRMPDRSAAAFGDVSYQPKRDQHPHLHVKVNAIFGACQVVEAP